MVFALLFAAPVHAATIAPACHTFSSGEAVFSDVTEESGPGICDSGRDTGDSAAAWARFEAADWRDIGLPKAMMAGITKFETLDIFAIDRDGAIRSRRFTPEDGTAVAGGSTFTLPLPAVTDRTEAVVIRIEKPWNRTVLASAALSDQQGGEGWPLDKLVFYSMLFGLFFAPLLFDIAYYWALRRSMVLWHGAMIIGFLGNVFLFSGLVTLFIDAPIVLLAKLNGVTVAVAVALAGIFASEFIEHGMLSPKMRRALILASIIAFVGPGFVTLHPPFLHYTAHQFFYLGFIPIAIVLPLAMVQATMRGSRSAKFLIVAWLPIILCGLERIVRGLGIYEAPVFFDELFYFSLAGEVLISAIGIADRLLSLRRQRDTALIEARVQETRAEHDPLTGLLNRRAIEPRFAQLCEEGFLTFALVDLDHFKTINDEDGHATGDEVLRAVGEALAPDKDTMVMRLGGEEFLMLLRGHRSRQHAEQRRQAVTRHIARQVPGLASPVTASMGLVEGSPETMAASTFDDLYTRADMLLYEAKQAGRNRTMGEKLTLFAPRRTERRQADRRRPAA